MTTGSRVQLFNRMMATRAELDAAFIEQASGEIARRAMLQEAVRTALRIGLYLPFANEVRTDRIFTEGDRHRKELYAPALDETTGETGFFRAMEAQEWEAAHEGIRTPAGRRSRLRDVNTLDVLIVPGVAFDLAGGRMGMGGGFYAECLSAFRGERVALAYDFQVVSDLPMGVEKNAVDSIVTEKRIIRCH